MALLLKNRIPPPASRAPAIKRAVLPAGIPPLLGNAFCASPLAGATFELAPGLCRFCACFSAYLAALSALCAIAGTATAAKTTEMRFTFKADPPCMLTLNCWSPFWAQKLHFAAREVRVFKGFSELQNQRHNVFRRMVTQPSFAEGLRALRSRAPAQEKVEGHCKHGQCDRTSG
jgi:hypothetical protein